MTTDDLSIAVYGSVARGDVDMISDRDALVVSDATIRRDAVRRALNAHRWNCTAYSWPRLESQAKSGGLFIHHLRLEAQIVRDPGARLRSVLDATPHIGSYRCVANESRALLQGLECMPYGALGRLWAADLLMVAFRGMAVATLAEDGVYAFSRTAIAHHLGRRGAPSGVLAAMSQLRKLKAQHRRGNHDRVPTHNELLKLIRVVDNTFKIGLQPDFANLDDVVALGTDPTRSGSWYLWARRVEACLKCVQLKASPPDLRREVSALMRIVRAPTDYGWMFSAHPAQIASRVEQVVDQASLFKEPRIRAA